MEEKRTATVRLPKNIAEFLNGGSGINQGIIRAAEELIMIKAVSLNELKGVFTPDEWKFFADSLNGLIVTDVSRYSVDMFITHCEDAELYDGAASRYGLDITELAEKLKRSLQGSTLDALYTRVEKLWSNSDQDLDKWAKF